MSPFTSTTPGRSSERRCVRHTSSKSSSSATSARPSTPVEPVSRIVGWPCKLISTDRLPPFRRGSPVAWPIRASGRSLFGHALPAGGGDPLMRGRGPIGPSRAGTGFVVPVQAIYQSARDEPADAAEFAAAMAELVSGVGIVTVRGRSGDPAGLLATSLCSFSVSPPTLLVCVDHRRRAHGALVACSCFAVHLLEADQETIADVFATGGGHKFDSVDWSWDDELPRLSDPLVYLRCRRR